MTIVQWQLLPVFVHATLVLALAIRTGLSRRTSVLQGETKLRDIALDNSKWPEPMRKLSNNFDNQFQFPMMFYGLTAFIIATGLADAVTAVLAWVFIGSRLVHSWIHTGSNYVPHRFYAFLVGVIALSAMWAWFGVKLFSAG
jgi:hypothetical protein